MNIVTGVASTELFGGDAPPHVREMIDAARERPREASGILWAAQALAPECLAVYYLLYKSHASRGELEQAERAALAGLREAGRQANLPRELTRELFEPPSQADFAGTGAARFWLFTLKALAFVSTRRGNVEEARLYLAWIERCDPSHSVGSEVTKALLAAAEP